jgi:hypothetical protein
VHGAGADANSTDRVLRAADEYAGARSHGGVHPSDGYTHKHADAHADADEDALSDQRREALDEACEL